MTSIIHFDQVTKDYALYYNLIGLKNFLFHFPRMIREMKERRFLALKEVSFEIFRGERVGFIGPNGAGKSTILSLIAGVLVPNKGVVKVDGRVSPLLELGAGFHHELTGRENIYLNGILLGMRQEEVAERFESIVQFSELGQFIEQPIRTYSSGMMARLGFSVAIHINPEILLIDEVLAVGDEHFRKKSFDKIMEFKEQGTTIVLVSHDLVSIEKMCDRVIWMERGQVVEVGADVKRIVERYRERSLVN